MKYLSLVLVSLLFLVGSAPVGMTQEASEPAAPSTGAGERKADQPETYDINYAYDAGNRRDPFLSLLQGIKQGSKAPRGALTVSDAKVVGITQSKDGYVAIIVGADNKSRFMKAGDKLYDGEIIAIEKDKVIFRQDLTEDTLAAPGLKSKEVVKRLHPVQEGT